MTKPITPSEVGAVKGNIFPPEVFQAFNELIAASYTNGSARVTQDAVIARITLLTITDPDTPNPEEAVAKLRRTIFDKGWLNVESFYEDAGWAVQYDKPGFSESYPATFTFTKRT